MELYERAIGCLLGLAVGETLGLGVLRSGDAPPKAIDDLRSAHSGAWGEHTANVVCGSAQRLAEHTEPTSSLHEGDANAVIATANRILGGDAAATKTARPAAAAIAASIPLALGELSAAVALDAFVAHPLPPADAHVGRAFLGALHAAVSGVRPIARIEEIAGFALAHPAVETSHDASALRDALTQALRGIGAGADFASAVRQAAGVGVLASTLTGALAGALRGSNDIPIQWREQVPHGRDLAGLAVRLVTLRERPQPTAP